MMKFRKNQKGFTLIEALIVVIIVAILAALGIARFLGVRESAAKATCQAHQSTLHASFKNWQLQNPATVFSASSPAAMTATNPALAFADAGSPLCPTGGTYTYVTTGTVTAASEWTSACSIAGHVSPH